MAEFTPEPYDCEANGHIWAHGYPDCAECGALFEQTAEPYPVGTLGAEIVAKARAAGEDPPPALERLRKSIPGQIARSGIMD